MLKRGLTEEIAQSKATYPDFSCSILLDLFHCCKQGWLHDLQGSDFLNVSLKRFPASLRRHYELFNRESAYKRQ